MANAFKFKKANLGQLTIIKNVHWDEDYQFHEYKRKSLKNTKS